MALSLMTKSRVGGALALLPLLLVLSCESSGSRASLEKQSSSKASSSPIGLTNDSLMSLVKKFAAGAENEETVFQELARYPRKEIIDRLSKLRDTLPADAFERISIAFLLCNLDHEVVTNKQAIVEAFTKEPHSKNVHAEWEASLIHRLITKGHDDLLPTLFAASEWSDGALSQSLSYYFADRLGSTPHEFTVALSTQPRDLRKAVYAHLAWAEVRPEDLNRFETYLNSISGAPLKATGREILASIRPKQN